MKTKPPGTWKGFALGVVAGAVLGSAAMAGASVTYKAWSRGSDDFRIGYIHGFLDVVRMAKNENPFGEIDRRYHLWAEVKPFEWYMHLVQFYRKEENHKYETSAALEFVSAELQQKHGKPPSIFENSSFVKSQLEKLRERGETPAPKKLTPQEIEEIEKRRAALIEKQGWDPGIGPWGRKKKGRHRDCPCAEATETSKAPASESKAPAAEAPAPPAAKAAD